MTTVPPNRSAGRHEPKPADREPVRQNTSQQNTSQSESTTGQAMVSRRPDRHASLLRDCTAGHCAPRSG
jgi:hypothetical protein